MSHHCYCILLRQAARKTSTIYDEALAPLGINIAQFSLLRKLERAGSLSLTELAHIAQLDRSTVGRNAKVLQRKNLIETLSGKDTRESKICLTENGHKTLENGAPLWDKAQKQIESKFDSNGAALLQTLLQAL